MMKCKICGQAFLSHVPNSHLETHGITRAEYKKLPVKEFVFRINSSYNKTNDDVMAHVVSTITKNKKKNNEYTKAKV